MKARSATLLGSALSGMLASACCIGPLVLALLGLSGAALAQELEPLRPYLLVVTYALLGGAFYTTYRPGEAACGPGEACDTLRAGRAGKVAVWVAGAIVVLVTTFPWYAVYLF